MSKVPTAETILEKHCPSMNNLYLDKQGIEFRDRIVKAIQEAVKSHLEAFKDSVKKHPIIKKDINGVDVLDNEALDLFFETYVKENLK